MAERVLGRGHRGRRQLRCVAPSDTHGPGAVGVLGSARATNEDNYLVQKLARAVLGTNNVDCCAGCATRPAPRA